MFPSACPIIIVIIIIVVIIIIIIIINSTLFLPSHVYSVKLATLILLLYYYVNTLLIFNILHC